MRQLLILALGLVLTAPAGAAEPAYLPEDAEQLQNCFEAVTDINLDPDSAETPTYRDCIGVASTACQAEPDGQTTIGMVACSARETAWWNEILNHNYATLQEALDAETFEALREAQRNWIAFRDAECSFQYSYWREGTIRSLYGASCQLQMTAERALALGEVIEWTGL